MEFSEFNTRKILCESVSIDRALPVNLSEADRFDFEGRGSYKTFDCMLQGYANVRVSSDSVIYENLVVRLESLYLGRHRTYYQTRHLAKKFLLGTRVKLDAAENYVLVTDQESGGHFHWLTEALPRIWVLRERTRDLVLLLPDKPYMRGTAQESLNLIGVQFKDVVWMQEDRFYEVPNLYRVTSLAESGQMHDQVMQELRRAFVGIRATGLKKVYVTRKNAIRRRVLNDRALIEILKDNGYEIFTSEGMCLQEQIEVFSDCSTIVGLHGAGLTNCLFMQPGKVIELKKSEPNLAYWNLAGSLAHDYYYFNGIPDSEMSLIGNGCNLTIPISDFSKKILTLI